MPFYSRQFRVNVWKSKMKHFYVKNEKRKSFLQKMYVWVQKKIPQKVIEQKKETQPKSWIIKIWTGGAIESRYLMRWFLLYFWTMYSSWMSPFYFLFINDYLVKSRLRKIVHCKPEWPIITDYPGQPSCLYDWRLALHGSCFTLFVQAP